MWPFIEKFANPSSKWWCLRHVPRPSVFVFVFSFILFLGDPMWSHKLIVFCILMAVLSYRLIYPILLFLDTQSFPSCSSLPPIKPSAGLADSTIITALEPILDLHRHCHHCHPSQHSLAWTTTMPS